MYIRAGGSGGVFLLQHISTPNRGGGKQEGMAGWGLERGLYVGTTYPHVLVCTCTLYLYLNLLRALALPPSP